MKDSIQEYVTSHYQETVALLKKLAAIPAPSGQERQRAEFVQNWLQEQGAAGVFIDGAGNVVYPHRCDTEGKLTVIMAHMDIVCPDMETLCLTEKDGRLIAPGVRDDTANLVNMMMAVKYLLKNREEASHILFVADTGEEGLGNLRGSREIFKTYGSRIHEWISFDLNYDVMFVRAVGSRRYRVKVRTKGGHSYRDFGEKNAIALLAELITELYQIRIPDITYNVGQIQGGTSVNSIAQEAWMLYEIRSESEDVLKTAENIFLETLERHRREEAAIEIQVLGVRPGSGQVDEERQRALEERCLKSIRERYQGPVERTAGSTDCNIPMSEGIPAVTIGTALGEGTHTRQEWVDLESMKTGQAIALEIVLGCGSQANVKK
ncbi:MAG: M20/M25/M40 family metallo-hydrolase [Eubacteriales bacterium]|nr:M20/M25/M40 family metallo-hydrolase [Eubacteriales bacterium]